MGPESLATEGKGNLFATGMDNGGDRGIRMLASLCACCGLGLDPAVPLFRQWLMCCSNKMQCRPTLSQALDHRSGSCSAPGDRGTSKNVGVEVGMMGGRGAPCFPRPPPIFPLVSSNFVHRSAMPPARAP